MARKHHIVTPEQAGQTLAAILRDLYEGLAWSRARELATSGRAMVNGEQQYDPAARLAEGDVVEADRAAPRQAARRLREDAMIHVDHDVVVVFKAAGVVTVPYEEDPRDTTSLVAMTRQTLLTSQKQRGGSVQRGIGVVQRLDKETSGLVVFPRTHAARKQLQQQFRQHSIQRRYLALVVGTPPEGTVDTHLVANRGDGRRGSWRGGGRPPREARRAVTHVSVLETFGEVSLVECNIDTGRQHQIRIHLAEAGHPLLGERVYRPKGVPGGPRADRVMLHAATLGFRHPSDGRPMHFSSPPPDDFDRLLQSLRDQRDL